MEADRDERITPYNGPLEDKDKEMIKLNDPAKSNLRDIQKKIIFFQEKASLIVNSYLSALNKNQGTYEVSEDFEFLISVEENEYDRENG